MKNSKIALFIFIAILISAIILVIKNQKKEIYRSQNLQTGVIDTYYEPTIGGALYQRSEEDFETEKKEELIKILLFSGSAMIIVGFFIFNLKKKEDELDPLKNLESLKEKSIISQDEYDLKMIEVKELEQLQKRNNEIEKETQKLISELENLKNKGIISEQEYNDKLLIVNKKTHL